MGLRFGALEIFLWRRHGQTANEPLHGVTKTEQWLGEGNRQARGFDFFLKSGWVWQIFELLPVFRERSGRVPVGERSPAQRTRCRRAAERRTRGEIARVASGRKAFQQPRHCRRMPLYAAAQDVTRLKLLCHPA